MKYIITVKSKTQSADVFVEGAIDNFEIKDLLQEALDSSDSFVEYLYILSCRLTHHPVQDHYMILRDGNNGYYLSDFIVNIDTQEIKEINQPPTLIFKYSGTERQVVNFEILNSEDKITGTEIKKNGKKQKGQFKQYKLSKASDISIRS